jgi:hypothetical protein
MRSSTPDRPKELIKSVSLVAAPEVLQEIVIENKKSVHETLISTLSTSSTIVSSFDATVSPGELLISFGEFKMSKTIQERVRKQKLSRNSLSEGSVYF